MKYAQGTRHLGRYRQRIAALRQKMRGIQKRIEPELVADYTFATVQGPTRLSQLFGSTRTRTAPSTTPTRATRVVSTS